MKKFTVLFLLALNTAFAHYDCYNWNPYHCASDCNCCNWGSIEVGGDWLRWKANEDRLEWGSVVDINMDVMATILRPCNHYDNGFRLYARYLTPDCDCPNDRWSGSWTGGWKISALYTRFATTAACGTSVNPATIESRFISLTDTNFPLLTFFVDSGLPLVSTQAQWKVQYNYFDLDLAKNFSICDFLAIAPHLGFRALWIDQKMHLTGQTQEGETLGMDVKQHLTGYGIEGGLLGNCSLGCGFSLVGHFGGAIFASRNKNQGALSFTDDLDLDISYRDPSNIGNAMVEGFLGVSYQRCVMSYPMEVHLLWEEQMVFNVNHFSIINGAAGLSLRGLTLGASMQF